MNKNILKKILVILIALILIVLLFDIMKSYEIKPVIEQSEYSKGYYVPYHNTWELDHSKYYHDRMFYINLSLFVENLIKESIKSNKMPMKYKDNFINENLFKKLDYTRHLDEVDIKDRGRIIGYKNADIYPHEGQPEPVLIRHINIEDYKKYMYLRLPICKFEDVSIEDKKATAIVEYDLRLKFNKKVKNDMKCYGAAKYMEKGSTVDMTYHIPMRIDLLMKNGKWVVTSVKERDIQECLIKKNQLTFWNKWYSFPFYQ